MTDNPSGFPVLVRETIGEAAHVCDPDGSPICGTPAHRKLVTVRPVDPSKYVTCSKCRKICGWPTVAGSFRSRSTSGLDSSAWGANRGR